VKILLITYYWPPAGGSGVQRWLHFSKYMAENGAELVVYCPSDASYAILDESLLTQVPKNIKVLQQPIFEPNHLLSFFGGKNKQSSAGFLNPNPSFFEKQLQFIRANYFIPDARKFWVKPSVSYLQKYLESQPVDVVITTGPPHSLHLIGLALKKSLNCKWIADFRDPWMEIDYFHQLPLTAGSVEKHRKMEREVAKTADGIIVVGKSMQVYFQQFNPNTEVITNGYDQVTSVAPVALDKKFSITHIGMMNADRDPQVFWKVLSMLKEEIPGFAEDLQIKLIGKIASEVRKNIYTYNLSESLIYIDYLPHHEVLRHQSSAQVLLLAVNKVPSAKGIITGKIFEYLQAGRPILAIAPTDGDLAEIIEQTHAGHTVDFEDAITLKKVIAAYYQLYKTDNLHQKTGNIEQYHRKNLTLQLQDFIEQTIKR
jgi:glycosyltransferase involved in cell wall biosynthesis